MPVELYLPPGGGGGGGSVATDSIWAVKGDLAVGTGAASAIRFPVGADYTKLVSDSATASGLRWSPDYFLNVRDYGAVGDGVADDGAAFANCYTAASGITNDPTKRPIVVLPQGRYKLDSTHGWILDRSKPVHVIGSNPHRYKGNSTATWAFEGAVLFRSAADYTTPSIPTSAAVASLVTVAGNIDAGPHSYKWTYLIGTDESELSAASNSVTNDGANGQNTITAPLGPTGTTARKLYRNKVSQGSVWYLQQTLNDNTTTSFVQDNTADASLGAAGPWDGQAINKRSVIRFDLPASLNNGQGSTFENLIVELQDPILAGTTAAVCVMGIFHEYRRLMIYNKNADAVGLYLPASASLYGQTLIDDNSYHVIRDCAMQSGCLFYSSNGSADNHNSIRLENNFVHRGTAPMATRPGLELGALFNGNIIGNRFETGAGGGYSTTVPAIKWIRCKFCTSIGNGGELGSGDAYFHWFTVGGSAQILIADPGSEVSISSGSRLVQFDTANGCMVLNNREGGGGTSYVTGVGDTGQTNFWLNNSTAAGSFVRMPFYRQGNGSPEGVVIGQPGTLYAQQDALSGKTALWVKSSGTGNTGWVKALQPGVYSRTAASSAISTTETVIATFTAAANYLSAGTVLRFSAAGNGTTGAPPSGTGTFRIRIGPTTLTGAIAGSVVGQFQQAQTTKPWNLDGSVTIRTAGVSGTAIGEMTIASRGSPNDLFLDTTNVSGNSTSVAVDTTVQNLVELTYVSSVAGSSIIVETGSIDPAYL